MCNRVCTARLCSRTPNERDRFVTVLSKTQLLNWCLKTRLKRMNCPCRQIEVGGEQWEREGEHLKQSKQPIPKKGLHQGLPCDSKVVGSPGQVSHWLESCPIHQRVAIQFWSEHTPGLRIPSPVGHVWEAREAINQCFSLSLINIFQHI